MLTFSDTYNFYQQKFKLCLPLKPLHEYACTFSFSSVQFSHSVMSNSLWPHDWNMPGSPVHHHLLERGQTHVCWVSHPTISSSPVPFSPCLQSFPASVSSNESVLCNRWPKYWSFSFSISPSNEYSELISFRMDWLDLLAVQGTLKSLLQHHSSKASIIWCSAFFMAQLSYSYMITGKTIALTIWTLLAK